MSQQQLFSVILRAIGVWEFVGGLIALPNYIASISMYDYDNQHQLLAIVVANVLSFCGLKMIAGCALFFLADWFSSKVYTTTRSSSDRSEGEAHK